MLKRFSILLLIAVLASSSAGAFVVPPEGGTTNADGLKLPPFKKVTLKNGLTVLLMEQYEIPIISFSFIVKAGSVADPAGKEGVASLAATLLRK